MRNNGDGYIVDSNFIIQAKVEFARMLLYSFNHDGIINPHGIYWSCQYIPYSCIKNMPKIYFIKTFLYVTHIT